MKEFKKKTGFSLFFGQKHIKYNFRIYHSDEDRRNRQIANDLPHLTAAVAETEDEITKVDVGIQTDFSRLVTHEDSNSRDYIVGRSDVDKGRKKNDYIIDPKLEESWGIYMTGITFYLDRFQKNWLRFVIDPERFGLPSEYV